MDEKLENFMIFDNNLDDRNYTFFEISTKGSCNTTPNFRSAGSPSDTVMTLKISISST